MLIINNRFLSLYDYNFLLVIEKIFSVNSKICLYDCEPNSDDEGLNLQEEARRQINPRDGWIPEEPGTRCCGFLVN